MSLIKIIYYGDGDIKQMSVYDGTLEGWWEINVWWRGIHKHGIVGTQVMFFLEKRILAGAIYSQTCVNGH